MTRRRALAALAAVAVVAGCSSSSAPSGLSDAAATRLQADVLALTRAAADHRWAAAEQLITQLRSDLASASAAGQVAPERAAAIRASLTAVSRDVAAARPTRTATHTPSSAPTTEAPPTEHGGHDEHDDHGKGKGHDDG